MEERLQKHLDLLIERYPILEPCKESIAKAYDIMEEAYSNGRKLLVAGNGGSAADSEHIVGELMKEFKLKRKIYLCPGRQTQEDRSRNGSGARREPPRHGRPQSLSLASLP